MGWGRGLDCEGWHFDFLVFLGEIDFLLRRGEKEELIKEMI